MEALTGKATLCCTHASLKQGCWHLLQCVCMYVYFLLIWLACCWHSGYVSWKWGRNKEVGGNRQHMDKDGIVSKRHVIDSPGSSLFLYLFSLFHHLFVIIIISSVHISTPLFPQIYYLCNFSHLTM